MTRRWTCGFELNSTTDGMEGPQDGDFDVSPGLSIATSPVRTGSYSGKITNGNGFTKILSGGNSQWFVRLYINLEDIDADSNIIRFFNSFNNRVRLRLKKSRTLVLQSINDVQIGDPSEVLLRNTWYQIEMKVDYSGAAGSHVVEARLNGVVFATSSSETIPNPFIMIAFGEFSGAIYFDDIALNDGTLTSQNSYPGAGRVVYLRPNASGDSNQLLKSDGSAGDANNYTDVDDVTPDDATTFVKHNTSGNIDDYNITNVPSELSTVNVVHVVTRVSGSSPTLGGTSHRSRIKKESGGTVSEDAGRTAQTNYQTFYHQTLYADPDGSAWTASTLNSAQIGLRITSTSANYTHLSAIWLIVDYNPAALSASGSLIQALAF